jgi:hypothetical protein
MLTPNPWSRHPDGTFQIDRYRENAQAMRRQAMEDTHKMRSLIKFLVAVGLLIAIAVTAPPKDDSGEAASAVRSSTRAAAHGLPERPPLF